MTTHHSSTARPWLLAAVGVASVHAGVLYTLWNNSGTSPETLEEASPVAQAWVIPVAAVAQIDTQTPPPPAHKPSVAPPDATPSPTADHSPDEPPASTTEITPATAEPEPVVVASATPEPAPATPEESPAAPAAAGTKPPPSSQWQYEVKGESKGLTYTAHGTLDWRQDGQQYEARLELKAFLVGSRVQTSSGTLGPGGLQPNQFSDRARKDKRLLFDHEAQLIRLDGSTATAPLTHGVQDRLSLFMQLSSLMAGLPHPPADGEQWAIWVAGSPAADHWSFRYLGAEMLQLPAGKLEAWHLQRLPRQDKDQQLDLWFAPSLHFLPVRMRIQQDNGDVVDQQLSSKSQ